ncbi:MAG: peptidoglycan-binding protein [Patescibacteria group bacterium]|jgi:peptidoglycan hydrolase-like protein with peptidoglycan-binding domain
MKKRVLKLLGCTILFTILLNLFFVDFGFASETINIDLTTGGTLNGVDRTKYADRLRLVSDKSFLANYEDSVRGTKDEIGSYSTAPTYASVKNGNGFRSREAVNETIGFAQNYSTGAGPVVLTVSTDDGYEAGGGYAGSFNQELADLLYDDNNDCYGTCAVGSGWKEMEYRYTEFIPSKWVDNPSLPDQSTSDDLRRIVAMGHEVGSHSVNHYGWSSGADRDYLSNIWINIYRKSSTGATSVSYSYNPDTQHLLIDETGTTPTDYDIDLSTSTTISDVYSAINTSISTAYTVTKLATDYDSQSKNDLDLAGISCNSYLPLQSCDVSIDNASSLYLSDTAVENILKDSKKSLEDIIGGDYEVKSLAYPAHIHDRHIMDLVSKYYQGARDGAGAVYAHQPNSSEAPEYSLSLYETPIFSVSGGDTWFVKADTNGTVDISATKALFKDKVLCTNTSGLNAATNLYGKTYAYSCFSKDKPWVNIFSHYWSQFDIHSTTDHNRGKQYIEATLQAIKELAELYPSNPPVLLKTFGQGTEYFRSRLPINYLQYGYQSYRAGRGTYQMSSRNNGFPPFTSGDATISLATSGDLAIDTINTALSLPSNNPVWKLRKDLDNLPAAEWALIRNSDYHMLSGQTYKFSLWACAPGVGTFLTKVRNNGGRNSWDNATLDTLTRGDCSDPANWTQRVKTVSVTTGTYESTDLGIYLGDTVPQYNYLYVTGVQFYNNGVAPDNGEWLNYATKSYVGLNYPAQNNIDYSVGTTSLWWKPLADNGWPTDRPIFSAKGIRAFYNRKSSKLIFETYDSSSGTWKTLEYSWTFSAATAYQLSFTWDAGIGKTIYIGGASVASDSATWTASAEGASDKLYVGTDYYGYADSQAYIDDFAVFPDVLSAEEVDAIYDQTSTLTDVYSAGNFTSEVYNVSYFQNDPYLNWSGVLNGGVTKFQIRSASSEAGIDSASWTGPSGASSYYSTSGEAVSLDNSNRYVQIKAFLEPNPSDSSQTPELTSLELSYAPDVTVPSLSLTTPSNNLATTDSSVVVAGTASDADSGLASVTVNGLAMSNPANFNQSVSLSLGTNTITVVATDNATNATTSTLTITRNALDITPPDLQITSHSTIVSNSTTNATALVIGAASDSGTGLKSVTLNGVPLINPASFSVLVALNLGTNTITLVATDNANNTTTKTISIIRENPVSTETVSTDSTQTPAESVSSYRFENNQTPASKHNNSATISRIQNILKYLGFFPDYIDSTGYFGSFTKKAIYLYQKSKGIVTSWYSWGAGYFGPKTRNALNEDIQNGTIPNSVIDEISQDEADNLQLPSDLFLGSEGDYVKILQQKLINQNYLNSKFLTGYYGYLTEKAVLSFQKDHNIDISNGGAGRVGPKTRAALNSF